MNKLLYDQPAASWLEALPLGNGRLGAMVGGEPLSGTIQMNEESVVYGGPIDRINQDAAAYFPEIRRLLKAGRIAESEELQLYALSGTPQSQRPYQTLGDFHYQIKGSGEKVESYRRELDLETGIAAVTFRQNEINYQLTAFISRETDALIVRFAVDQPGALSMSALMTRGRCYNRAGKAGDDCIYLDGDLGRGGSEFAIIAKAAAVGGTVKVIGEHLIVEAATEAIFYINGVTTFPHREAPVTDCLAYLQEQAAAFQADSYQAIRAEHTSRHREMFNRSVLTLGADPEQESLTTAKRLELLRQGGTDTGLAALYYGYGRYLLMSSSMPGGLPANLQGIWCEKLEPTWDAKYTININTEMNYWPAEICNLSECHRPLFDLLKRVMENGRRTAREMYGCRGFVAHHNTDVWADTAPQDFAPAASYWVMGGAWLTTHIWKHYCYTRDLDFLAEMFPVLKECVLFFLDYLVEEEGQVLLYPSVSPENTYIMENGEIGRTCINSTMDVAILRDIFSQYLSAAELLGDDPEICAQVSDKLGKLPGFQTGRHGQLLEWQEDYEEWEPGHRHFSHLYPLFPSNQISEYQHGELLGACEKVLERRMAAGGGHTGWSCAWLINLYARLQQGDQAAEYLDYLLSKLTAPNLFDMHPPLERIAGIPWVFQIDGNFGGSCGIAQMLLQSHLDEIFLLPALPRNWPEGQITGLCAEGGFEVSLSWQEGRLQEGRLHSRQGQTAVIRSKEQLQISRDGKAVECRLDQRGRYVFNTEAGAGYTLTALR